MIFQKTKLKFFIGLRIENIQMVNAGVGISNLKDSFKAGVEASKKAEKRIKGKPSLVLVFSVERFDQERLLQGVRSVVGNVKLIGCCGAGVISKERLSKDSVGVMIIASEEDENELEVEIALARNISKNPKKAGEKIAKKLKKKTKLDNRSIILLPDGFTCNVSEIVKGVYNILGPKFKLVGGGAGDNLRFIRTYQFINQEVYTNALAAAMIASSSPIGIGVAHGWTPIGNFLMVTKAKNKTIIELDGKPAILAYQRCCKLKEILPEQFPEIGMKHPLGMSDIAGNYIIRDPLTLNKDGSINCVAEVPEGSVVRIMGGNSESVVLAAEKAANHAMKALGNKKPALAIVFDCVSRLLLLGKKAEEEIEKVRRVIGREVPLIGFHTFGEIGAFEGAPPMFHNKTIAVYLVGKNE